MGYYFAAVRRKMTAVYTNSIVHRVAVLIAYASYVTHIALPSYTRYLTYTMNSTSLWLTAGFIIEISKYPTLLLYSKSLKR